MRFLWLIVIFGIMFVYSCSDDGLSPARYIFKVAAILDLSGHYSQFGKEVQNGLELFLESNNENFEIEYYDSEGLADKALTQFNQASLDTNVKAVITLASWISNAVAPVAKMKNVLHFAVGSAVFEYPDNGNTVRFTGDVSDESVYMTDYLKDFNSVGLMYFNNDYGKGWETRLTAALGPKLKITRSYTDTDTDFTTILQKMKTANPEIIVLISTREAVEITKQAKQLGITSKLLGNRPILTDALLKEPAADGLVFTYPDLNDEHHAIKKYIAQYRKKPSAFVAEGYDLAISLVVATRNMKFDRKNVYDFYTDLSYNGMFTKIDFDSNAQAKSKYNLMIIKDGNYQDYK
jgi:ABC-type branched-subunit amino acid transport system substrate-binding protein